MLQSPQGARIVAVIPYHLPETLSVTVPARGANCSGSQCTCGMRFTLQSPQGARIVARIHRINEEVCSYSPRKGREL